jgi:hypothetical protein
MKLLRGIQPANVLEGAIIYYKPSLEKSRNHPHS